MDANLLDNYRNYQNIIKNKIPDIIRQITEENKYEDFILR
jgi:hypothetical protein